MICACLCNLCAPFLSQLKIVKVLPLLEQVQSGSSDTLGDHVQ